MTRDSTASEETSSRNYWAFVLWSAAVIVFYVLSIGPAALLVNKGLVSEKALVIYGPLLGAINQSVLHKPVYRYIGFWVPEPSEVYYEYLGPCPGAWVEGG